jgi:hypothetical protein
MALNDSRESGTSGRQLGAVLLAWLLVSVPLLWGVWQTVKKATALFR